uniref:Brca1-associated protein n=1 Tax=Lutzomyia longipalpis TaxID=7200 RepID=A0A1B0CVF8_LUTLO
MSVLVSLCHIKFEVDAPPAMNSEETADGACAIPSDTANPTRSTQMNRGQRQPRNIKVENYTNRVLESSDSSRGLLPPSSREVTPMDETPPPKADVPDDITFFSGNPFVEVTKGIIHLYKKNEMTDMMDCQSKTLCLLAVPAILSCHDLQNFVAPCHSVIQHVRIIRDGSPNQFMVLLEFRTIESAIEFYETYNGVPYNSLEPDSLCHAVWVSSVVWGFDETPPVGHTELPTCPVCLERMDESVDGVLTILCNHAFHASCLVKWGDSTCPVCRCVQTPELTESSVCMECEGTEALWICLICGHVGCGRYQGGHAFSHYRMSNHTYALQLGTNRVWDYVGDNFVHRLLQSKTDGKLVATQSPEGDGEEKIDSMQLEFTYLLTSQLDAQREYYEDKLSRLESLVTSETDKIKAHTAKITEQNANLEGKVKELTKDKAALEKKVAQLTTKLNTISKELTDERQMGKAMQTNQSQWQTKFSTLEKRFKEMQVEKDATITDLKEQVRDLSFYMEAQSVIANSEIKEELASGTVIIPEGSAGQRGKNRRRRN